MAIPSSTAIDKSNEAIWLSRYSDSASVVKKAESILKQAEKIKYHGGVANARLNIAALAFYRSDNKTALKYLTEAFRWFDKNRHEKGYVRALLIKGNIYESFGDYENTLNFWLEALKASRETEDIGSEGEACSQLGLIYTRLCNFPKALEFFNKGLKIREDLNDENAVASSLNRIGMVLRQTKKYEESLGYYFRSLGIRRRNKQGSAIPWTLLGIASTYEDMKKYPEAAEHYEQGMKGADKRCRLQCMMGAGRVYSKLGESQKAEGRLEESLLMATELKSLVLIADAHSALATHYEHYKKPDKALRNFKKYLKAKEAYQSTEVQSRLSNIEVAHAIERSEQEKEIYRLRHVELKEAYDIIEEKNHDITASINYASRIQRAILPSVKDIEGLEESIFILYLPKDIVSGDYYWFSTIGDKLILIAADCTGHGVPGAFMSMLGNSFLEEIINTNKITDPGVILDNLSREVKRALHQKGNINEAKDGMDISICVIDRKRNTLQFSGAYNNLYLVRNGELNEYNADRMPIGYYDDEDKKFTSRLIETQTGDMIYMYSDGYADQFGGADHKKFKYTALKNMVLEICKLPLWEQRDKLEKRFLEWRGSQEQTDDVIVLGYRL
jgi:serine phosphatase RsbU (regulator of sigma subunit)